jgi:transposase
MKVIVNQIEDTQTRIAALERQLLDIAPAIAATVADPNIFRSGREFAAWLGLNTGAPRPIGSTPSCSNALFSRTLKSACAQRCSLRRNFVSPASD